eukprot:9039158-Pyramimonas_sp.AAC.1
MSRRPHCAEPAHADHAQADVGSAAVLETQQARPRWRPDPHVRPPRRRRAEGVEDGLHVGAAPHQ